MIVVLPAAGWAAPRLLWPDLRPWLGMSYVVTAAAITAATAVAAFFAWYVMIISTGLCGSDGSSTPAAGSIAMIPVYGLVGLWAFQRPRRLLWAWPLAIVLAVAVALVITAAIPSAHGYCET